MLCVANVCAKKENGSYKLFNALPITTKNWRIKTVGSITYHYSPDYKFNMANAERMNAFADSLQKLYSLKPVKADFYIGKNIDELMKLDGLEFYMGMGNAFKPSGFTDRGNNIIFSGGEMGHPLEWHIKRMNNYLKIHPEINLDSIYTFIYMDNYTNPEAELGGFLCKLANEKGGIKELKTLLSFGSSEDDFY